MALLFLHAFQFASAPRCFMCLGVPKQVEGLSRKSDTKGVPTYSGKVLSKAEINDIYREESEGTQGSS